jgi:hypothetical protein
MRSGLPVTIGGLNEGCATRVRMAMTRCFPQSRSAFLLLMLAPFCGCATRRVVQFPDHQPDEPVRSVIFKDAPEIRSLADRARKTGNESYPKVLEVLGETPSEAPKHFDIVFQNHASTKTLLNDSSGGFTKGGTIYLGLDWLTNSPHELDPYLVHEVAHVAQDYSWWRTPPHWSEGLAEYARFKLGYTNSWTCAKCSAMYPHYTSGYCCAAAFLFFVESNYDPQIAIQLNHALRKRTYSDELFKKATGEDLAQLWKAFEQTPDFTPGAAEILKLEDSLGYADGHPTRKTKPGAQLEISRARALAVVSEQPGGAALADACKFLWDLRDKDQLPGWHQGEKGHVDLVLNSQELANAPQYPLRWTIKVAKDRDGLAYHFTLSQQAKGAAWKLEKSWCTDKGGQFIRDL